MCVDLCIKCLLRCRIYTCWSKPTSVFGQWVVPTAKLRAEWSLGQDGHAARPCSNISSADCTRQRRPIGARLHGATACSRDLRRSQLPDPATLCNCKDRRRTCWISRISANNRCVIRERPSGSEKAKSGPQIKDSACSFLSCSIFHGIGQ